MSKYVVVEVVQPDPPYRHHLVLNHLSRLFVAATLALCGNIARAEPAAPLSGGSQNSGKAVSQKPNA